MYPRETVAVVPAPRSASDDEKLLTPGEVAAKFRVDPKTVTRWAAAGRIPSIRTPGGHRRFRAGVINALLEEGFENAETNSDAEFQSEV